MKDKILQDIEKNDPIITEIDLSNAGIFNEDLIKLKNSLLKNNYITSIDLSFNNISSVEILSTLNIKKINLNANNVGDKGVEYLLKIPSLEWLTLNKNSLTDLGVKLLMEKVKSSRVSNKSEFFNKGDKGFYATALGCKKADKNLINKLYQLSNNPHISNSQTENHELEKKIRETKKIINNFSLEFDKFNAGNVNEKDLANFIKSFSQELLKGVEKIEQNNLSPTILKNNSN